MSQEGHTARSGNVRIGNPGLSDSKAHILSSTLYILEKLELADFLKSEITKNQNKTVLVKCKILVQGLQGYHFMA